ncbi:DUF3592 domain-containing protein [Streptomyces sp. NPDC054796]
MSSRTDWAWILVPLLLGSVFLIIGLTGIRRTYVLRRRGAKAYGQVVAHRTSSGAKSGTLYHPVIAWTTDTGLRKEEATSTGRSWVGSFQPGTQVVVRYDSTDSNRWIVEGYGHGANWVFAVVGAVVLAGTVGVAFLV